MNLLQNHTFFTCILTIWAVLDVINLWLSVSLANRRHKEDAEHAAEFVALKDAVQAMERRR